MLIWNSQKASYAILHEIQFHLVHKSLLLNHPAHDQFERLESKNISWLPVYAFI